MSRRERPQSANEHGLGVEAVSNGNVEAVSIGEKEGDAISIQSPVQASVSEIIESAVLVSEQEPMDVDPPNHQPNRHNMKKIMLLYRKFRLHPSRTVQSQELPMLHQVVLGVINPCDLL